MKNHGSAILHWAIQKGSLSLLKACLDFGSNKSISDDEGWSPLHQAAIRNHSLIVSCLLEKGADVDSRGPMERTPLHQAA
ncbi:ankyrin, partial [Lepidopterella palustris CBS 459.81]